ncbi:MAG: hypothetical protein WAU45_08865 [Blastocatellia bacterium]
MLSLNHRSKAPLLVAALVFAWSFSVAAPAAFASDRSPDSVKAAARESSPSGSALGSPEAKPTTDAEATTLGITYAAYDGAISSPPEVSASRPRSVARMVESVNAATARPIPLPAPQRSSGVISTAPMTAGEKFEAWFRSHFLSPGSYGKAVFNGMWKELQDNDDFKEDTVSNFFADSMTRAARNFTSSTTNGFYEKALFASLFRQDPRYHRSGKKGAGAKIGYAVTRVFVTQGDRCGCHQFNASFLLGGAAGAVTANLWERSERTGPIHTIRRYYNHIAITALFNVVREFVGGQ